MIVAQLLSTAALAFAPVQAAQPQTPPAGAATTSGSGTAATAGARPSAGATVFGAGGERIGTIDSVTADAAVIDNGTNKAAVPLNAFASDANGFKITLTKAQFDTAAAQAAAQSQGQLKSQLVAGAQVKASDNTTVLGTVKAVEGDLVTLTTSKGDIRVPLKGFAAGPNGIVSGLTPAQIEAAAGSATPSSNATPAAQPTAKR